MFKTVYFHTIKPNFLKTVTQGLLLFSVFLVLPFAANAAVVELHGWAWSSNIGWVGFNCLDASACGTSNYKVLFDNVSGNLTGEAWSSNIGWIRFNPSDTPPGAPTTPAQVTLATGAVTGWIRACSVYASGCSGVLKNSSARGGWDGWIKMSGTNHTSPNLTGNGGVTYDAADGRIIGFAWGGDVVGWLRFCAANETDFCVTVSSLPPDLDVTAGPSVKSGSLIPGDLITFQGTVTNIGGSVAGGTFTNGFLIDLDSSAFVTADVIRSGDSITALAAGASSVVDSDAGTWTAVAGTHTIRLSADDTSSVVESNEANNWNDWTFTVSLAPPPPNLTTDHAPITINGPLTPGTLLTFTATVKNDSLSTGAPAGSIGRWCINGTEAECYTTTATELNTHSFGAFSADMISSPRTSDTWLAVTGSHIIRWCADVTTVVAESDETSSNNCTELPFVVSSAPVDGECGATLNACTAGTFDDIPDSATNYLWNCLGENGGSNASCSLPITGGGSFSFSCADTITYYPGLPDVTADTDPPCDIMVNFSPALTSKSTIATFTIAPIGGFTNNITFDVLDVFDGWGPPGAPITLIGFQEVYNNVISSNHEEGYPYNPVNFSIRVSKFEANPDNDRRFTVRMRAIGGSTTVDFDLRLTLKATGPGFGEQ